MADIRIWFMLEKEINVISVKKERTDLNRVQLGPYRSFVLPKSKFLKLPCLSFHLPDSIKSIVYWLCTDLKLNLKLKWYYMKKNKRRNNGSYSECPIEYGADYAKVLEGLFNFSK